MFKLSETGEKSSEFRRSTREPLSIQAKVRTLTHCITTKCKDIDEFTTKEGIVVVAAIYSQFEIGEPVIVEMISL